MLNEQGLQQGTPATVVNAATAAGTANSAPFAFPPSLKSGRLRDLLYEATGTYSVCTANLEVSIDGGVTWVVVQKAIDLFAAPAGTFSLTGGPQYRLNIQTFTGTSITVALVLA